MDEGERGLAEGGASPEAQGWEPQCVGPAVPPHREAKAAGAEQRVDSELQHPSGYHRLGLATSQNVSGIALPSPRR